MMALKKVILTSGELFRETVSSFDKHYVIFTKQLIVLVKRELVAHTKSALF